MVYQSPVIMGTGTPIATTPLTRDWDSQSLHSDILANPMTQGTSIEYLRDLVQKRIITLNYVRNIHEGYVVSSPRTSLTFAGAVIGFILS